MIEIRRSDIAELALGDRGLWADEVFSLDEGFVVIPSLLHVHEVKRRLEEFERLVAREQAQGANEPGTRRAVAAATDGVFEICWRHRVVLEAAAHILGETIQIGGNVVLRDAKPGGGEQQLHPDYGPTPTIGLNATWFLDEFTAENGATRLLPGTHRSTVPPPGAYSRELVPGEVVAVGPPGSVLLRHTYLFHGGGRNATTAPRRAAWALVRHEAH